MMPKLVLTILTLCLAAGPAAAELASGSYKPGKGFTWRTDDGSAALTLADGRALRVARRRAADVRAVLQG